MSDQNQTNETSADETVQQSMATDVELRCLKCGMVNPTSNWEEKCRGCDRQLWRAGYTEYRRPGQRREKYEIVRCPSCGRIMKNVSADSVECELCGKLLDVVAHRVSSEDASHVAFLKISILILFVGLFVLGIVAAVYLKRFDGIAFGPIFAWGSVFLWFAAFPFLAYCWGKASRGK
ncbi:MAG: hypothetical protein PVH19_04270 [Planctomycetia bacterium]|jgi:hypothetical protein